MIQESFTLKHVNLLTSEKSVEFLGRTIKHLKNGNITMEFLRSSLMCCSSSLMSLARSQQQVSSFKLFPKIRGLSVARSSIKNSGQRLANLLGWLKHPVKELSRSLINPQDQDTKNWFICSSTSIRQEISSLSWNLNFQSAISKEILKFRLSALEIQTGQVVKNHGSQQVVHWFQCSMPTFSQPADLRHQLLTHQQRE